MLGESYVIDYDVTNASKYFDAQITMSCTGSTEYLLVQNEYASVTIDLSNSTLEDMEYMFYQTGYNSSNVSINLSNSKVGDEMDYAFYRTGDNSSAVNIILDGIDTSEVWDMNYMFYKMGYNSTALDTSITIRYPYSINSIKMLTGVATKPGTSFIVNYTAKNSSVVDSIVATKTEGANVVKGEQVS